MSLFAGLSYVLAVAALAPQSPPEDERTALELKLGKAEVAYAKCLDEAVADAAIALVPPAKGRDRVRAACAAEWDSYAALRRQERRFVLQSAPDADGPSPEHYALRFRRQFEREVGRSYTAMLEQARAWPACVAEVGAKRCVVRARSAYEACLQGAVRMPSFTAAESESAARSAALRKCEHKLDALAVAARLGETPEEIRDIFRRRMRARISYAWRRVLERRPKIMESCGAGADPGCGQERD